MRDIVKDVIELLKVTSEHRSHRSNLAKTYVLFESGEFVELGINYSIVGDKHIIKHEVVDNVIKSKIIYEKYVLCYGISLPNIITLLHNKGIQILGIATHISKNTMMREYSITLLGVNMIRPQAFRFIEDYNFNTFGHTEIGDYLLEIYKIGYYADKQTN